MSTRSRSIDPRAVATIALGVALLVALGIQVRNGPLVFDEPLADAVASGPVRSSRG